MKVQSYVLKKDVLVDTEYELLCNICGSWNSESSFAVKVADIQSCLDVTIDLDTGEEVMDCSGRVWIPDYDGDINFMTKLLKEAEGCEFVIVEFDYEGCNCEN